MSTYKIEVPDHGDDEVNRMAVAYAAMSGQTAAPNKQESDERCPE